MLGNSTATAMMVPQAAESLLDVDFLSLFHSNSGSTGSTGSDGLGNLTMQPFLIRISRCKRFIHLHFTFKANEPTLQIFFSFFFTEMSSVCKILAKGKFSLFLLKHYHEFVCVVQYIARLKQHKCFVIHI